MASELVPLRKCNLAFNHAICLFGQNSLQSLVKTLSDDSICISDSICQFVRSRMQRFYGYHSLWLLCRTIYPES